MQRLFVLFTVCSLSAATLNAATIHVPADSATIQAGIDGASSGDTVLVADGTYTGDGNRYLTFTGKNIVLRSQNGPSVTIIDCGGSPSQQHMALHLHTGVDSTAVIDGFTITNAYDTSSYGAAVVCDDASPTIRNCVITGNDCSGILCSQGSPHIESCRIANNSMWGVYSFSAYPPIRIADCEISDNGLDGVFIAWSGMLEMSNCLLRDNGDRGLLILTFGEEYFVTNCTFVGNAYGMTFWFNYPRSKPVGRDFDSTAVMNCIFAYNENKGLEIDPTFINTAIVRCNNSYGNPGGNYDHWPLDTTVSFGNDSLHPLFCDTAAGDFRIAVESPCAPANNSCSALMGAFDTACTCCENRGNVDRLTGPGGPVDVADLTYLISYLFQGGPEPPCPEEGNVDSGLGPGGPIDVGDVTYLVAYLFQSGPEPPPCP